MTTSVPGPIAVIAHYNLLERLEPAGPGELFRARDTKKGRTVAMRVLPKDFTEPSGRQAFMEKARGLVALSHPNVTTVFEVGEHEDRLYIVFEFLKGQSLRSEMGGRPINVRRAMDLDHTLNQIHDPVVRDARSGIEICLDRSIVPQCRVRNLYYQYSGSRMLRLEIFR